MKFKIAILGASSQIAQDVVTHLLENSDNQLFLYARNQNADKNWFSLELFSKQKYDIVVNFIGSGNPKKTYEMGPSIFDVTYQHDELVINYLKKNPQCKYIFLSSGAAYGGDFEKPVTAETKAEVNFNALKPQDWYAVAKLYAECRHRALSEYYIYDVRIFNYFSHTQDMSARFLITDIIRAIKSHTVLETSPDCILRDFITPPDFCQLIDCIIKSPPQNMAIDCYTKAPIDKSSILKIMHEQFGLKFTVSDKFAAINATGLKPHYYSLNKVAETLGYTPNLSSAEGLLEQTNQILTFQ
jgi:nucleoside-diphosphate-sugar epimerase